MADDDPWPPTGARECLDRLATHPLWAARGDLPPGEGVGLAIGVWAGSAKPAAATCRLEPDGTLSVIGGDRRPQRRREQHGRAGRGDVRPPDGRRDRHPGRRHGLRAGVHPRPTASAITYALGPAVIAAVAEARERLLRIAADDFEIEPRDLEIADGIVRPRGSRSLGRPVADYALELSEAFASPYPPVEGHASVAHTTTAPSAAGHLAHVRVDVDTGVVELLSYVVVQDAGLALNPALVEGQMIGGTVRPWAGPSGRG